MVPRERPSAVTPPLRGAWRERILIAALALTFHQLARSMPRHIGRMRQSFTRQTMIKLAQPVGTTPTQEGLVGSVDGVGIRGADSRVGDQRERIFDIGGSKDGRAAEGVGIARVAHRPEVCGEAAAEATSHSRPIV